MAKITRHVFQSTTDTVCIRSKPKTRICNLYNFFVTVVLISNITLVRCQNNETEESYDSNNLDSYIKKRIKLVENVAGRSFVGNIYENGTFRTGNILWDNILNQCTVKPSVSCLQKNFYSYIDNSLNYDGDIKLTSGVCFKKNNVDIKKYSKEANIIYLTGSKDPYDDNGKSLDEENEINDEEESETPLEEVTNALYDKGVNFLVTHDMKLTLPEFFFHGATLKISPRALTKTGALVHIDLEPKVDDYGEARLFFIKKIKQQIKKKLIFAAIAVILVVKLIALKLIFVLPVILGVTTAKKMFLKLLLFLFPALSHIFKLCSWYHQNYHTTKHHHHHHLISHHHKVPHAPSYSHHPYGAESGSTVVRPHAAGPPSFEHYPQDWELSGPGLGNEYLATDIHRNAIANFKPQANDINDINAWGLGQPPAGAPGPSMNVGEINVNSNTIPMGAPPGPGGPQRVPLGISNPGRPMGPQNPYYRHKKPISRDPVLSEKEALIRAASLAARAPPSPVRDEILRVSQAKLTETNRVRAETELVKHQQQIIAASNPETVAAEKFYGALLEKVDQILTPIGAFDTGCRERAICALYRDPFKHTPYSNLVSNELSKDSSELLPPADSNSAIKYYRYVQAARDGQEQKDCVLLYPSCNIDYTKK